MTITDAKNPEDAWLPSGYVNIPTEDLTDNESAQQGGGEEENGSDEDSERKNDGKGSPMDKAEFGKWLVIGGSVALGVAAIPIVVGFGSAGIVGGSIAAAIQSSIGNIAAGSAFAIAQSLGAQGVFASVAYAGGATMITGAALKHSANQDEANEGGSDITE
jgi:hypothetical protein